jgi:hypothetical protein
MSWRCKQIRAARSCSVSLRAWTRPSKAAEQRVMNGAIVPSSRRQLGTGCGGRRGRRYRSLLETVGARRLDGTPAGCTVYRKGAALGGPPPAVCGRAPASTRQDRSAAHYEADAAEGPSSQRAAGVMQAKSGTTSTSSAMLLAPAALPARQPPAAAAARLGWPGSTAGLGCWTPARVHLARGTQTSGCAGCSSWPAGARVQRGGLRREMWHREVWIPGRLAQLVSFVLWVKP